MKYTRYNPKKKKENDGLKFLFVLILIVFAAFLIGTLMYRVFIKENIEGGDRTPKPITEDITKENQKNDDNDNGKVEKSSTEFKLYGIQCGVFANKDNADELSTKLKSAYNVFYGEDNSKYRVLVGIYEGDDGIKILDTLKGDGYSVAKVSLELNVKDICDAEIGEMIRANLKLLNKLDEKDVQSVETKDLKEWIKTLKEVDGNSKNFEVFKETKEFIGSLPENLTRENSGDNYTKIFSVIKKIK